MAQVKEPRHMLVANVLLIIALGLLNGGAAALNMQMDYALPILPILFFFSALASLVFWMYSASKLRLEPDALKKAALFAALPWWVLSLPPMVAVVISLFTADDAMKAVGWGLLTVLPLVAGTLCWGVHIMIAKVHPSLKK
tara:strand:+ start:748 stop:1167 length:420 start_codon:yes stop_codon:yes gene_type:complete